MRPLTRHEAPIISRRAIRVSLWGWSTVLIVAAAIGLLIASPASAQPPSLDSVTCTWPPAGVVGGTNVNFSGQGTQNCRVHWGTDAGFGQSGLGFDGSAPPSQIIALNTPFDLGSLLHFNNPILFGTNATSADLMLNLTISEGVETVNPSFTFTFAIDETLNTPCPPPGCDDIITFPSAFPAEVFTLGGETLTLQLLGFGATPDDLSSSFVSPEGLTNEAMLWARITQVTRVTEPGTLLLLATSLLSFLAYRRRGLAAVA